ncbi:hypothetical protein LOK49_LG12G01435 [Camellia lanceoleosa]|uniref:Uncharacterized protein n=1 Tax=Camellia lanceoleosa TaxID=1840588 RepID=A0ACC0FP97_9ERIC|nr:hypothetical protein LOK49_LG12G01435 [Camellia lanceoleosa]
MLHREVGLPGLFREVEALDLLEVQGLKELGHPGLTEELEEQGRLADAGHPLSRMTRRRSQIMCQRHPLEREALVLVPGAETSLRRIRRMTAPIQMVMKMQRLSRRRG